MLPNKIKKEKKKIDGDFSKTKIGIQTNKAKKTKMSPPQTIKTEVASAVEIKATPPPRVRRNLRVELTPEEFAIQHADAFAKQRHTDKVFGVSPENSSMMQMDGVIPAAYRIFLETNPE